MVGNYLVNPTDSELRNESDLLMRIASRGLDNPATYNNRGVQSVLVRNGVSSYGVFDQEISETSHLPVSLAAEILTSVKEFAPTGNYSTLNRKVRKNAIDLAKSLEKSIIRAYISLPTVNAKDNRSYRNVLSSLSEQISKDEENLQKLVNNSGDYLFVEEEYLSNHHRQMLTIANDSIDFALNSFDDKINNYSNDRSYVGEITVPASDDLAQLISKMDQFEEKLSRVPILYAAFSKSLVKKDQLIEIGSDVQRIRSSIDKIAINEITRLSKELHMSTINDISRYHLGDISLEQFSNNLMDRTFYLDQASEELSLRVSSDDNKELIKQGLVRTKKFVEDRLTSYVNRNLVPALDEYEEIFVNLFASHLEGDHSEQTKFSLGLQAISHQIETKYLPFSNLVSNHFDAEVLSQRYENLQNGLSTNIQQGIRDAIAKKESASSFPINFAAQGDEEKTVIILERAMGQLANVSGQAQDPNFSK